MKRLSVDTGLFLGVLVIIGLVILFAVRADGFTNDLVDPHDGNAWLLRGGQEDPLVVSVNGLTQETAVRRRYTSGIDANLDIHQNGTRAFLQVNDSLRLINGSTASISENRISIPGENESQVKLSADTLAAWVAETGDLWLNRVSSLSAGDELVDGRSLDFAGPIDVRLSATGETWAYQHDSATFSVVDLANSAEETTVSLDAGTTVHDFTVIGDDVVATTDTGLAVITRAGSVRVIELSTPDGVPTDILRLQEPSEPESFIDGRRSVIASTINGLFAIGLESGDVVELTNEPIAMRADVAPVVTGGCAYALGDGVFLRSCIGGETIGRQAGSGSMRLPRLRVVRELVFFEDWHANVVSVWPPGASEPVEIDELPEVADAEQDVCGEDDVCLRGGNDVGQDEGLTGLGSSASDNQQDQDDGIDDPPEALDDEFRILAGRTAVLDVLMNDREPDGDPLGVVLAQVPDGLSVVPRPDRTVAISARPGTEGQTLEFTYRATDGTLESNIATVKVEVLGAASSAPILEPDDIEATVGVQTRYNVLFNDKDNDGEPLVLVGLGLGESDFEGTLLHSADGWLTVVPGANDVGEHRLQYTASDGTTEVESHVIVTVAELEDTLPEPNPDFVRLEWGGSKQFNLLANDIDRDNDELMLTGPIRAVEGERFVTVTKLQDGVVRIATIGEPQEQPRSAQFIYSVTDDDGPAIDAVLRVQVNPQADVNRPPVPISDRLEVRQGESGEINVLRNDLDPDVGDVPRLLPTLESQNEAVSAVQVGPATVRVTVAKDAAQGVYEILYVIDDTSGAQSTGSILVNVPENREFPNQPPVVNDGRSFELVAGDERSVPLHDPEVILDPDGDRLSVRVVSVDPNAEAVSASVGGREDAWTIVATARLEAVGAFTITYEVEDDAGASARGSFTIDVVPVAPNEAPVADDDSFVVVQGVSTALPVLAGNNGSGRDFDPNDDELTIGQINGATLEGTLELSIDGTFVTFTPARGFVGSTSFKYTAVDDGDPSLESSFATVTVRVDPPPASNQPPVARGESRVLTLADGPVPLRVLDNDSDPDLGDHDRLVLVDDVTDPDNRFELRIGASGLPTDLVFTPTEGDEGKTFSARYVVRDPAGATSDRVTVTVEVEEVNSFTLEAGALPAIGVERNGEAAPVDVIELASYDGPETIEVFDVVADAGTVAVDGSSILFVADTEAPSATVTYRLRAGELEDAGEIQYRITAIAPDTAPVANDDTGGEIVVGVPTEVLVADLLRNDRDGEGRRGVEATLSVNDVSPEGSGGTASLAGGVVRVTGEAEGRFTVRYTVEDSETGLTDWALLSFEVVFDTEANRAPEAVVRQPIQMDVGGSTAVDLALWVDDESPQTLTFRSPSVSPSGRVTPSLTRQTLELIAQTAGNATISVLASDGEFEVPISVEVEVADTDAPPDAPDRTLTVGANQNSNWVDLLDDTNGARAEIESLPSEAQLNAAGVLTWTRQAGDDDSVDIELTYRIANDAGDLGTPGTITVDVAARVEVVIDATPFTQTMASSQTRITGNILNGGTRVRVVSGDPEGSLDPATGDIDFVRIGTAADQIEFDYVVVNAAGEGDSARVTLIIEPDEGPPDPPSNITCSTENVSFDQGTITGWDEVWRWNSSVTDHEIERVYGHGGRTVDDVNGTSWRHSWDARGGVVLNGAVWTITAIDANGTRSEPAAIPDGVRCEVPEDPVGPLNPPSGLAASFVQCIVGGQFDGLAHVRFSWSDTNNGTATWQAQVIGNAGQSTIFDTHNNGTDLFVDPLRIDVGTNNILYARAVRDGQTSSWATLPESAISGLIPCGSGVRPEPPTGLSASFVQCISGGQYDGLAHVRFAWNDTNNGTATWQAQVIGNAGQSTIFDTHNNGTDLFVDPLRIDVGTNNILYARAVRDGPTSSWATLPESAISGLVDCNQGSVSPVPVSFQYSWSTDPNAVTFPSRQVPVPAGHTARLEDGFDENSPDFLPTLSANGTFALHQDGGSTNWGYKDSATFTYELLDASGTSTGTSTIVINVRPNPPILLNVSVGQSTNGAVRVVAVTQIINNTAMWATPGATVVGAGEIVIGPQSPSEHYVDYQFEANGTYPGSVTLANDAGTVSMAFTITITDVNAPVIDAAGHIGTMSASENNYSTNILQGGSSVRVVSGDPMGSLDTASGAINHSRVGTTGYTLTFGYEVLNSDGSAGSPGTVTITVEPQEDIQYLTQADIDDFCISTGWEAAAIAPGPQLVCSAGTLSAGLPIDGPGGLCDHLFPGYSIGRHGGGPLGVECVKPLT